MRFGKHHLYDEILLNGSAGQSRGGSRSTADKTLPTTAEGVDENDFDEFN